MRIFVHCQQSDIQIEGANSNIERYIDVQKQRCLAHNSPWLCRYSSPSSSCRVYKQIVSLERAPPKRSMMFVMEPAYTHACNGSKGGYFQSNDNSFAGSRRGD